MENRIEPHFETEPRRKALALPDFALHSQITEDKVWELIEEGQISARFVGDRVLILPDQPSFDREEKLQDFRKTPEFENETLGLPEIPVKDDRGGAVHHDDFVEDTSDILVFAQDALSRNAALSKELLDTKDELLRLKEERITFLTDLLSQKEKEIRQLNRSLEEFATLKKFEGY